LVSFAPDFQPSNAVIGLFQNGNWPKPDKMQGGREPGPSGWTAHPLLFCEPSLGRLAAIADLKVSFPYYATNFPAEPISQYSIFTRPPPFVRYITDSGRDLR
jgi:hypothetical protein